MVMRASRQPNDWECLTLIIANCRFTFGNNSHILIFIPFGSCTHPHPLAPSPLLPTLPLFSPSFLAPFSHPLPPMVPSNREFLSWAILGSRNQASWVILVGRRANCLWSSPVELIREVPDFRGQEARKQVDWYQTYMDIKFCVSFRFL